MQLEWWKRVLSHVPIDDERVPFDALASLQLELREWIKARPSSVEFLAVLSNVLECKATKELNRHFIEDDRTKEETQIVHRTIVEIQRLLESCLTKEQLGGFHAYRRTHAGKHSG